MKSFIKLVSLSSIFAVCFPAFANLSVNLGVITAEPSDNSTHLSVVESLAGLETDSTQAAVGTNTQIGITIDYQLNPNWTVELIAATPFTHQISVKGSAVDGLKIGETKHLPPTLLMQYHFGNPSDDLRFFAGAGLNYTVFFDESAAPELVSTLQALNVATASDKVELDLDDSFGIAMQFGANYKLNDNWGLHAMVSFMDIDTDAEVKVNGTTAQAVAVEIDPMVWMLAAKYYF
ncbi:OmpW/AlkL family protein [Catenovulum maritimum]|uniref:Membrane protein n=1 Tax=Catenovulum maritimum TaxID=1513271 RepID=A0A0J8JJC6_9ALTE|nr:OmpW family outer membrane protein [Catenovulum maritimum]KMT64526.1 membrane protein [Catenovulum maritimum]